MNPMLLLNRISTRIVLAATTIPVLAAALATAPLHAQQPAAVSQLGTVKSVAADTVVITTKTGDVTVTVIPEGKVLVLAPGVTKLDQATPGAVADIAVGDRVLATGKAGDTPDTLSAQRVVLMKAAAVANLHQAEQADWAKRGVGGIVKSVSGDTVVISTAAKTITIQTSPATVVHRYADDSVKFEDAKPSTVSAIKVGDQIRARGAHSADNTSVTADEIVDGSFANLSGLITAIDPTAGTVTFKDLATKKPVTVKFTANSDIRKIDPTASARFLGGSTGGPGGPGGTPGGGAPGGGMPPGGGAPPSGGGGYQRTGGAGASRSADLTRMMARLPQTPLTALKPGDAVMVVASQPAPGNPYTAITMLAGVEQILAAKPAKDGETIQLEPFNMGDMGGGMGGPGGGGL
jgi:hypothetical protein